MFTAWIFQKDNCFPQVAVSERLRRWDKATQNEPGWGLTGDSMQIFKMDNYNTFVWLTHSLPPTQLSACLKIWKKKQQKNRKVFDTVVQWWASQQQSHRFDPFLVWVCMFSPWFCSFLLHSNNVHVRPKVSMVPQWIVVPVGCCSGCESVRGRSYPVLLKASSTFHLRAELLIYVPTHPRNVDLQGEKCFWQRLFHLSCTLLNLDEHWLDWQMLNMHDIHDDGGCDQVKGCPKTYFYQSIQLHHMSRCAVY